MPTYQFECERCGAISTAIAKMSDYENLDKMCVKEQVDGTVCGGNLIQDYSDRGTQNFILQGGGWTPKFGPINRG